MLELSLELHRSLRLNRSSSRKIREYIRNMEANMARLQKKSSTNDALDDAPAYKFSPMINMKRRNQMVDRLSNLRKDINR